MVGRVATIHAEIQIMRKELLRDECGACIRTRANTEEDYWGIMLEIFIHVFAPSLCTDVVAVFTQPCGINAYRHFKC